MSDMPPEDAYHLNSEAAEELVRQITQAQSILGRIAAGLAGLEPGRPSDLRDLVERKHVQQAAEVLWGPVAAGTAIDVLRKRGSSKAVFISHATEDEDAAHELAALLKQAKVSCFVAKKSIPHAAEWAVTIFQAIKDCRVFAPLVSAAAKRSRWCTLEIGAALGQKKQVVPVSLDSTKPPQVLAHLQIAKFRTEDQKRRLVNSLRELCSP